jgi:putative endonuclease
MKTYYVYMLTNERQTLYIGITSDLIKRVYQHKTKEVKGFTEKYNIDKLVYYEETSDVRSAIEREKKLKKWKREWKIKLIDEFNPAWEDLYKKINC